MDKAVKSSAKRDGGGGKLEISLHDPGMTLLHRVGLAGLWMTLEQLEKENGGVAALGQGIWSRTPTSVTIEWSGDGDSFFRELFDRSFKVDKNGLVWLTALGEPSLNLEAAVVLNEALLGTFLQHGNTRKADKSKKPTGMASFSVDEITYVVQYHRICKYHHQYKSLNLVKENVIKGWLFPGASVRHNAFEKETALKESSSRALALRYAPAGTIYFEIRTKKSGIRPRYALVVPYIKDLEHYAAIRKVFLKQGVKFLYASSTTDAGYRVLAEMYSADFLETTSLESCRVISFGTVPWERQQKVRVDILTVYSRTPSAIEIYKRSRAALPNRPVKPKEKQPYWDIPQILELVAKNLSEGRSWWNGFSEFIADKSVGDHVFDWEKGGLAEMVNDEVVMPESAEKTIVKACHEAWRRRMGKISERARREGLDFNKYVRQEFSRIRVEFSRCKNAATLRQTLTDFWARGGPLPPLQESWHDVLPLLDEMNWRKARDLALLALASYKPVSKEEEEAMSGQEDDDREV